MTPSEVRFAALLAVRSSVVILITAMLLVPVGSIINRVFAGTWYVNWRLMHYLQATRSILE